MSRGGRGGFGRGRGRGAGATNLPIGVTYAELQSLSRESEPLFPKPLEPMPVLTKINGGESEIFQLQTDLIRRLNHSEYYLREEARSEGELLLKSGHNFHLPDLWSEELERYSDRFRPNSRTQPTLRKNLLNKDFFPPMLWDACFDNKSGLQRKQSKGKGKAINIDWMAVEAEDGQTSVQLRTGADEKREEGEEVEEENQEDYDQGEDNEYERNWFDDGEDDHDDLGDGDVGDGDGAAEGDYA